MPKKIVEYQFVEDSTQTIKGIRIETSVFKDVIFEFIDVKLVENDGISKVFKGPVRLDFSYKILSNPRNCATNSRKFKLIANQILLHCVAMHKETGTATTLDPDKDVEIANAN